MYSRTRLNYPYLACLLSITPGSSNLILMRNVSANRGRVSVRYIASAVHLELGRSRIAAPDFYAPSLY